MDIETGSQTQVELEFATKRYERGSTWERRGGEGRQSL